MNKFGGENDIIEIDLNNDGTKEVIFAYKYNCDAYIGVGEYEGDKFIVFDTYHKMGLDISYLNIKFVLNSKNKTIITGFKIRNISSNLDLIIFENFKLKSILTDPNIYFGKIDAIDFNKDGIYEIALWTHDTGEAYIISIYEFKDNEFSKTNKYDKSYYPKVL